MPLLDRNTVSNSFVGPAGLGHGPCGDRIPPGFKALESVYGVLLKSDLRGRNDVVNQFSIKWDIPAPAASSTFWIYMGIMLENCETFGSITVWKGSPLAQNQWAMAGGFYDQTVLLDITPGMILPTGHTIMGDVFRDQRNYWILDTYDGKVKMPVRLIKRVPKEAHWVYVALEMTDGGANPALYPRSEGIKFYDIRINDEKANLEWIDMYRKPCITDIVQDDDSVFVKWSP